MIFNELCTWLYIMNKRWADGLPISEEVISKFIDRADKHYLSGELTTAQYEHLFLLLPE